MNNYCCSVFPTNVAPVLLVIVHFLPFASELGECVDHDAWDDVPEQQAKENEVNQICHKTHKLELLNGSSYRPADVEIHDATDDGVTWVSWVCLAHQVEGICFIAYETENVDEYDPQHSYWEELIQVVEYGIEDIGQGLILKEEVDDVDEEGWLAIESSEQACYQVQEHILELLVEPDYDVELAGSHYPGQEADDFWWNWTVFTVSLGLLWAVQGHSTLRPQPLLLFCKGFFVLLGPELGQLELALVVTDEVRYRDEELYEVDCEQDGPDEIRLEVDDLVVLDDDVSSEEP